MEGAVKSMKNKNKVFCGRLELLFSWKTLVICIAGVVVNILAGKLMEWGHIPGHLELVGSVLTAATCGSIPGILAAVISGFLLCINNPLARLYVPGAIIMIYFAAKMSERGLLRTKKGMLLYFFTVLVIDQAGNYLVGQRFWNIFEGGDMASYYTAFLAKRGVEEGVKRQIGEWLLAGLNSGCIVGIVGAVLRKLPRVFREHTPYGYLYGGTEQELEKMQEEYSRPYEGKSVLITIIRTVKIVISFMILCVSIHCIGFYYDRNYCVDHDMQKFYVYVVGILGVQFVIALVGIYMAGGLCYYHIHLPILAIVNQSLSFSKADPEEWLASEEWKNRTVIKTKDEIQILYETICQTEEKIVQEFCEQKESSQIQHEAEKNDLEQRIRSELEDILVAAGMGMWTIELESSAPPRMYVDRQMKKLLYIERWELTPEEVYDAWYSRIKDTALESVQRSVQEMMDKGQSENTYIWVHPIEGEMYVRCGGTSSQLEDGTWVLRGYHSNVTDIVEADLRQKRELADALSAAQQANKAKTVFLNNMSHDIRTPMNAIMGYSSLAKEHVDAPERVQDYLEKISTSSSYLLTLINDILDMSRIESGNVQLDEVDCSLEEIMQSIHSILQQDIEDKQMEYRMDRINVSHDSVTCDKLRLSQILINIISNSIKYTKANGRISVHVIEKDGAPDGYGDYKFTIRDNGVGINADFLQHIYEPFTREESSTISGIQGTGLGLAITRNLVHMMQGEIAIRSEEGVGTETIVTLRLKTCQTIMKKEELLEREDFSGKRVLLVEDNEMNREIAEEILQEDGLIVEIAENGSVAMKKFEEAEVGYYQMIFMDIQMPIMDGYEATRGIRALDREDAKAVPIVALTANAFQEDRKLAKEAGMNEHLSKPFRRKSIYQVLVKYLQ